MGRRRPAELLAALRDGSPEDARIARWLVRQRVDRHPELRKALAEHYRSLKEPAQAARWGIVFPGWATPREVARLRVWLAGEATRGDFIRDALRLRPSQPIPEQVADLTDPVFHRRRPRARLEAVMRWVAIAGMIVGLVGVVGVLTVIGRMLWLGLFGQTTHDDLSGLMISVVACGAGLALTVFAVSSIQPAPIAPESADRRAIELVQERPEEGRAMLRALTQDDTTASVRRALVEDARRRGRPDEAGRWGCTVAGLTTPDEQSAYADWLLRKGRPEWRRERLFDASRVPWSDLTAGDVPAVLRILGEPPSNPLSDLQDVPGPYLRWWLLPLVALPIYAIATTAPWADPRATAATGFWLVFAVWAALSAIAAVRRRGAARFRYAMAAAVFAVVTAVFIFIGRL